MFRFAVFFTFFISFYAFSQQKILGSVVSEDGVSINGAWIINMKTQEKTTTNSSGEFSINASAGDEIRAVRGGYDRKSIIVSQGNSVLNFVLTRSVQNIEQVELQKLSGNLSKDSQKMNKDDPFEENRKALEVPEPVGKPREEPSKLGRDVLLPIATGNLNIQGMYNVLSGKSRKLRSLYKYEDLQEKINWIKERSETSYFVEMGIPEAKIDEFLMYSILSSNKIEMGIKEKNINRVLFDLDGCATDYLKMNEVSEQKNKDSLNNLTNH